MAPPPYSDPQKQELIAKLKANLAYVLAKADVNVNSQAHLAKCGVTSLAWFAMLGEDQAGCVAMLKNDLLLDNEENLEAEILAADVLSAWSVARIMYEKAAELEADAQLAEQSRSVPVSEHKKMKKGLRELARHNAPGRNSRAVLPRHKD